MWTTKSIAKNFLFNLKFYSYLGENNFEVKSDDELILAHFDVPKLTPHCMRVLLSQFYRDQWRLFKPSEFCFEFSMQNEVYFHSETEFLQATSALVGNALSCMALLEENKKMLVTAKDYIYYKSPSMLNTEIEHISITANPTYERWTTYY